MHIVALTHLFFPARGGTENSLREWTTRLAGKDHRVSVVTSNQQTLEDFIQPRANPSLPLKECKDGVQIIRIPLTRKQRFVLAKAGAVALRSRLPGGEALWFMTHIPYLPQMIHTARRLKPDLIYAVPFPTATIYYASVVARKTGCPWVIQPHLHMKDINTSLGKILRWILPKASALLTNTNAEKEYLIREGISGNKIHALGQGINLSLLEGGDGLRFRKTLGLSNEPVILFLGRKVENKGLDTLLETMPLIWKEVSRAVLILAGQSSPYFQHLFNSHPLAQDPRIFSLDNFPEEKKVDLLTACDLLILPSQVESFGVVFLEAWAKGKPVIGARLPAVEEMIDGGEDGFLVPYGNPVTMAEAAIQLIKDPELRQSMGEKGKLKVFNRFEINRVTDRLEALFSSLVKG